MTYRFPVQILIFSALAACSASDEARSARAVTYPDGSPHPMTPWGDPDLQGN